VREWWNQGELAYDRPQAHLTELAGLGKAPLAGKYPCEKGVIIVSPASPADLAHDPQGAQKVLKVVEQACAGSGISFVPSHFFALRRGPYLAAAAMDEEDIDEHATLAGRWVNLFDPELAVMIDPKIEPGTRWLLYDLDHCPEHPWLIAAAGRVSNETWSEGVLTFTVEGMANTICSLRARVPGKPSGVIAGGNPAAFKWDAASQTVWVKFENRCKGMPVEIHW
jgi:hypothetical protein